MKGKSRHEKAALKLTDNTFKCVYWVEFATHPSFAENAKQMTAWHKKCNKKVFIYKTKNINNI